MEMGAARVGSAKGGKSARSKNKKRGGSGSCKKRPTSASAPLAGGGGGAAHSGPDRYHATSFPLVSDVSTPPLEDESSSRMSWCGEEAAPPWGCLSFLFLPTVVHLKIFSFLPNVDKGKAALVCQQWALLLQSPSLWDRLSFSQLPQSCLPSAAAQHSPRDQCYGCFQRRVSLFSQHVERVCPNLRYLEFKFDISDSKSGYLQMIEGVLSHCKCRELSVAHINWKETPSEPLWLDGGGGEGEMGRCEEMVQKHRFRQRLFIQLFERLTTMAPRLSTLVLPFDWSESSIACLGRLKGLQNLVVEKYFVFQHLPQSSLHSFLHAIPSLTRLLLEVWTPSAHGMLMYTMNHKGLQYLDISQSRGFYLQALCMPHLQRFRVARHPWNGPLVLAEHINIVCLHTVLAAGAPRLTKVNDHYLEKDWQLSPSDRLEEVLKGVCSCRKHKTGWAMY